MRVHRKSRFEPIYRQNAPKCSSLSLCTVEHLLFHHFRSVRSRPSRSPLRHAISQLPHLPRCPYYITPFSRCQPLFALFCKFLAVLFCFSFSFFYFSLISSLFYRLFIEKFAKFKTRFFFEMVRMNGRDDLSPYARGRAGGGM